MTRPVKFTYYQSRPGVMTDYSTRSPDELIRDVNVLHDFTRNLVREKTEMEIKLEQTRNRLKFANLKIWILTFVVGAEGAILGCLFKWFVERLGR